MVFTPICTTTKSGMGPCTHWLTSEGVMLVLTNSMEVEQNAAQAPGFAIKERS